MSDYNEMRRKLRKCIGPFIGSDIDKNTALLISKKIKRVLNIENRVMIKRIVYTRIFVKTNERWYEFKFEDSFNEPEVPFKYIWE